jgi:hypothetical protein
MGFVAALVITIVAVVTCTWSSEGCFRQGQEDCLTDPLSLYTNPIIHCGFKSLIKPPSHPPPPQYLTPNGPQRSTRYDEDGKEVTVCVEMPMEKGTCGREGVRYKRELTGRMEEEGGSIIEGEGSNRTEGEGVRYKRGLTDSRGYSFDNIISHMRLGYQPRPISSTMDGSLCTGKSKVKKCWVGQEEVTCEISAVMTARCVCNPIHSDPDGGHTKFPKKMDKYFFDTLGAQKTDQRGHLVRLRYYIRIKLQTVVPRLKIKGLNSSFSI